MEEHANQAPIQPDNTKHEIGTYWDVFLEPSKCFEGLNLRPRWLVPMVLCVVIAFVTSLVIYSRVDMEHVIREQITSNPRAAQLTDEQLEQQVEMGAKFGRISTLAAPFIITPLFMLLTAGLIMLGIFVTGSEVTGQVETKKCSKCGGEVPLNASAGDKCPHCGVVWGTEIHPVPRQAESSSAFKKVFSITASSMLFYNAAAGILTIAVILTASDPNSLNLRNIVSTNPAFLVDANESKALYAFLSHLDILVWYTIYLIGLGISKITAKCSVIKGMVIIGFWYVLYVVAHTGIAALF